MTSGEQASPPPRLRPPPGRPAQRYRTYLSAALCPSPWVGVAAKARLTSTHQSLKPLVGYLNVIRHALHIYIWKGPRGRRGDAPIQRCPPHPPASPELQNQPNTNPPFSFYELSITPAARGSQPSVSPFQMQRGSAPWSSSPPCEGRTPSTPIEPNIGGYPRFYRDRKLHWRIQENN